MPQLRKQRAILSFILGIAILLIGIAMPLRAQPTHDPLTLAEYRAELANAIEQLETASAHQSDNQSDNEIESTIKSLRTHFEGIEQVQFENGTIVTVDSIFIDSILDASISPFDSQTSADDSWADIKERLLARLQGAIAQIDASGTDNTVERLALLDEVLARPEFNTPVSLWERFWRWFEGLLRRILPESTGQGGSWIIPFLRILPWIVTIIAVASALLLLTYWLQRLLRNFVNDARNAELYGDDDLPRTAAEARQQAHEAAQSGLYRDAVRRLYLAAILQLAENDLIDYERSLTNREVLTRLPATSPIRPHLEPIVNTFDQVWYGIHEPDRATFTAYEQEIDALATVAKQVAAQISTRAEQNTAKGQA